MMLRETLQQRRGGANANLQRLWMLPLLGLCLASFVLRCDARAVNVSNTWTMPQEGLNVFYRFFRDRISWFEADAVCQFHHANLVTVDNSFQFDATRDLLRELDVNDIVWIGLMRPQNSDRFMWSNSRPLVVDTGYWAESLPLMDAPLCAVIDPIRDYRWHALRCGGPETASFLCEMPVPSWADACILKEMPNLTMQYMADTASIELIRNCQEEGLLRHTCKGKEDRERAVRELICPKERLEAQRINDITNSHFKSLQIINNIRTDNNENNDIELLPLMPNYNTRVHNIDVATPAVSAPIERFSLDKLMLADAPAVVPTSVPLTRYHIPDEIPMPVKKSAKKVNPNDEYGKKLLAQHQTQIEQQQRKVTPNPKSTVSHLDMMMGDQPALSEEQLPEDVSDSDASNEIFEPLPHKKKVLPEDLRTMPPIAEETATKAAATATEAAAAATTVAPATTTMTTTTVAALATTAAAETTTTTAAPTTTTTTTAAPTTEAAATTTVAAPATTTILVTTTPTTTTAAPAISQSTAPPATATTITRAMPPLTTATTRATTEINNIMITTTTTAAAAAAAAATEVEVETEADTTVVATTGNTYNTYTSSSSSTSTSTTTTTSPSPTIAVMPMATSTVSIAHPIHPAQQSRDEMPHQQQQQQHVKETADNSHFIPPMLLVKSHYVPPAKHSGEHGEHIEHGEHKAEHVTYGPLTTTSATAIVTTSEEAATSGRNTVADTSTTTTPIAIASKTAATITTTAAASTMPATITSAASAAAATSTTTQIVMTTEMPQLLATKTTITTTTTKQPTANENSSTATAATSTVAAATPAAATTQMNHDTKMQLETESETEQDEELVDAVGGATTRRNFLQEETEAPFKPNRRRSLTKPENVSYFKKILG